MLSEKPSIMDQEKVYVKDHIKICNRFVLFYIVSLVIDFVVKKALILIRKSKPLKWSSLPYTFINGIRYREIWITSHSFTLCKMMIFYKDRLSLIQVSHAIVKLQKKKKEEIKAWERACKSVIETLKKTS